MSKTGREAKDCQGLNKQSLFNPSRVLVTSTFCQSRHYWGLRKKTFAFQSCQDRFW